MQGNNLSENALSQVLPHVHSALGHLLRAWDELSRIEKIVQFEITTMELSELAGGLGRADEVSNLVNRDLVKEWLKLIARTAK